MKKSLKRFSHDLWSEIDSILNPANRRNGESIAGQKQCMLLSGSSLYLPTQFQRFLSQHRKTLSCINLISATSPLLRGEVLLSVRESYLSLLEKSARTQSLVDEWNRSEHSLNLSNCRTTPCPSLPGVCTHCQRCPKDQQH